MNYAHLFQTLGIFTLIADLLVAISCIDPYRDPSKTRCIWIIALFIIGTLALSIGIGLGK